MINLIRYYIHEYLEVASRTPAMDDNDGYLSQSIDDYHTCIHYINMWSIASCL